MPRIDVDLLEEEWDEDYRPARGPVISDAAARRIQEDTPGRVLVVDRGRVTVLVDSEVHEANYAGSMRGEKVAVGDHVRVRLPRHDGDTARVTERLPRETVLMRTADDDEEDERVVVANADQVITVIGADYLAGGVGFLERVLVAASVGGLDPMVCVNKIDLVEDDSEVAELEARYGALGIEVLRTSAETGEGIETLRWRLAEVWTAFTGHSGVGKSSLVNLLVPDAEQLVGEIGPRGGRHTTVAARAIPIPSEDAWLVDTPGVRSFGLGTVVPEELHRHFPELADLGPEELGAVERDERVAGLDAHPDRLASYRRFLAALRSGRD